MRERGGLDFVVCGGLRKGRVEGVTFFGWGGGLGE